jgi:hypothetical protein
MIDVDGMLETKKFQMYAEKADTEEKRIELCKKYLKHKGMDPDKPGPMGPIGEYIATTHDTGLIRRLSNRIVVDAIDVEQLRGQMGPLMEVELKRKCADGIMETVMREGYIRFSTSRDMSRDQYIVNAELFVWRDNKK